MDYASSTPVLKEVREVMDKYYTKDFYNPGAIYQEALGVKSDISEARKKVARILGASSSGIVFTSSGTESNNLAILGAYQKSLETFVKPHILVSNIEHPAVLKACEEVVRRGGEMSLVEVDEYGVVSLESLKKNLKKNTFLVSIGLANSEIGTVEPVSKVARVIKEFRKENNSKYPLLHTDASQAPSFLPVGVEQLQVDLLTIDASKIYGPKGSALLAIRSGVEIQPVIVGGSQERGLRAGTENPSAIVGLAKALEIAERDRESELERLEALREEFIKLVEEKIPEALINGSRESHLPNIVSISIPNTLSEFILLKLDKEGVMISVGTTCSLDELVSGSPVIEALGKGYLKESTLRFSFGRETNLNEVKEVVEKLYRVTRI